MTNTAMKRAAPPEILTSTAHGRTLRFTFAAGEGVPTHSHANAQVTIAVLEGQMQVNTDTQHHLGAGQVLTHHGNNEISLLALTDSQVLVCLIHE